MRPADVVELGDPAWAGFVAGHPDALPFHLPAWGETIAAAYGMRPFALVTRDPDGSVVAGIPFIEVALPFRGKRWVALPFTDLCPPLAGSSAAEADLAAAVEAAGSAAGVRRVEVRGPITGGRLLEDAGVRHVLELDPDPQAVYRRFHPSQVHRNIRRAERSGLEVRRGSADDDLLDVFYALHLSTRRRLGVPVQPRRFFTALRERMLAGGHGWIVAVESSGRPVAAALFMEAGSTVVYKYGASDRGAWALRPNHLLFWHAIREACERGHRRFDFGRSDPEAEGLRAFKSAWGAIEEPLRYHAFGDVPTPDARSTGLAARALGGLIRNGPEWVCRATGELLYRFTA